MKVWSSEYTFNHPWETVVKAAWRKYPNPITTAVIGTDVIDRKLTNGLLLTHRLVSSRWGLPRWVQKIIGSEKICYASEQSVVNPSTKSMTLKSRNLSFGNNVAIDEMISYQPHPENNDKTILRQDVVVTVKGVPLSFYLEEMLTNTIMANAGKGRQAIEWVIDKLNKEMKELKVNAVKSTDEVFTQTRRSIDGIAATAWKSMDDISFANKNPFKDG